MEEQSITGIGEDVSPVVCELTFGEKAVGLGFNPANDPIVHKVKTLYAEIIDLCNGLLPEKGSEMSEIDMDRTRLLKIAITEAQGAQMWAVKAITWKY